MRKKFSTSWKSSKKPNKQRKYRFNAPLHIKAKFLNATLSKDLRKKHGMRSIRVRAGDKVRIMRGQFKKIEGKVEEVNLKSSKIYVSKAEHTKRDGTKARYPITPSNVMIIELNLEDKMRLGAQEKSQKPGQDSKTSGNNAEKTAEKHTEKNIEKPAAKTQKPKAAPKSKSQDSKE